MEHILVKSRSCITNARIYTTTGSRHAQVEQETEQKNKHGKFSSSIIFVASLQNKKEIGKEKMHSFRLPLDTMANLIRFLIR